MIPGIWSDGKAFLRLYFPSCTFPKCVPGLGSVNRGGARKWQVDGLFAQVDGGLQSGSKELAKSEASGKRANSFFSVAEINMGRKWVFPQIRELLPPTLP